jgi:hypothetical protein
MSLKIITSLGTDKVVSLYSDMKVPVSQLLTISSSGGLAWIIDISSENTIVSQHGDWPCFSLSY